MRRLLKKLIPLAVYNSRIWRRTIARPLRDYRDHRFSELVSRVRPHRILEIGVKYGWGAERMVSAAGARDGCDVEYYGFDFFYSSALMERIQKKLRKLGVKKTWLFAGDSRKTLPIMVPTLPKMDFIYIDGGKECTKDDWLNVQPLVHDGTVVVIDDYDLDVVKRVVDAIGGYQVEILDCNPPKAVVSLSRGS